MKCKHCDGYIVEVKTKKGAKYLHAPTTLGGGYFVHCEGSQLTMRAEPE